MSQALAAPSSARVWLIAARPQTLPVAVAPVAVGAAVAAANGAPRWDAVCAALFGALLIQVGTNFANDVFDYEKGADDEARLGPPRAVQNGWLTPRAVKTGMLLAFGLASCAGIYLTVVSGPIIVALGVASILSGLAYTGGPYPLGYHGLGDVFVFVFFGLVAVCGTTFVAIGSVPVSGVFAAIPVGALATAVLVVNNARDHATDARVGKRTLAVRFGRRFATWEYVTLILVAFATPLALVVVYARPSFLLALAPLPWAATLVRQVARREGRELNPVLPATARLLLVVSACLALGFVLGGRT